MMLILAVELHQLMYIKLDRITLGCLSLFRDHLQCRNDVHGFFSILFFAGALVGFELPMQ